MANNFNIGKIFNDVFGYQMPKRFQIPQAPERKETSKLGQPLYGTDLYGREFFMPIRFLGVLKSGIQFTPFNYLIPFAVVSIACKKNIVSTPLVERSGTVKELINTEDYLINIKGIIVRPDNEWPESEIILLERIFNINTSIILRSPLTDIFLKGDFEHRVIIRSLNLPANPGVEHSKPFELECESDQIFTLELE